MSTQQPLNNVNIFADLAAFEAHTTPAIGNDELTLVGGVAVVVESYVNGTSWYRIWSDGFIEQGGYLDGDSAAQTQVTLLTPFSNTNYAVELTASYNATLDASLAVSTNATYPKAVSSFYFYNATATALGAYWKASGY